jgi:cytochrome c5
MKKIHVFLAATVMASILTASVLSPVNPTGKKSTTSMTADSIPADLQLIFKKSCMDCHATGGSHMAMSMLNFSDWNNYEAGKQAKKAGAICYMISKGSMPPKSYRAANPDAIPTEAQKDKICKWSETLKQKK